MSNNQYIFHRITSRILITILLKFLIYNPDYGYICLILSNYMSKKIKKQKITIKAILLYVTYVLKFNYTYSFPSCLRMMKINKKKSYHFQNFNNLVPVLLYDQINSLTRITGMH